MNSINRIIFLAASLLVAVIISKDAFAVHAEKSLSFEMKPQNLIFSTVPNSKVFSGAGEIIVSDDFAIFAAVDQMKLQLHNSGNKTDFGPEKGFSAKLTDFERKKINLGIRMYSDTSHDSWFTEIYTGSEHETVTLAREEAEVTSTMIRSKNGAAIGYRWIWEVGFLIRISAGMNSVKSKSLEISHNGAGSESAESLIQEVAHYGEVARRTVNNTYDLGVGWTF